MSTSNKLQGLDEAHQRLLFADAKTKTYAKGELLLREGQTCKGIYYITEGLVGIYKTYKDKLYYQDFFMEGAFASEVGSLTRGAPTAENLIALEDVHCRYISKTSLLALYEESAAFQTFGRQVLEQLLSQKSQLAFVRASLPAKEKYAYILEHHPAYIQRVPLQLLASFLGMSRETLSRMRKV